MNVAKKIVVIVCAMAAVCFSMPVAVGAEGSAIRSADRKGSWDFILPLTYADDTKIDGQGGSSADIDDDFGIGFGFGYNFNNHFQLNGGFNWNSRTYEATVAVSDGSERKYSNYMEMSTIALNGIYYFLDKNFTPFVSGMIGYTWVDTNIQDAPAETYCWYDPWWGYVCNDYVPTKTQDDWTYGAGIGIRYDFNKSFSMQGSYNKSWVDLETSGTTDFDLWRMDFIFRMF
ncbi:hypothetical protein Dvar_52420 [Desulfosarcina variabilis str. Montpellier]|uniref:outer membrane beta-barrel protein n=1 Tax=Desulfosarcina variabilis TaxID=2300 RepID=UPI003AFA377E